MSEVKYLIELHKPEGCYEPSSCDYFNWSKGVNRQSMLKELKKLESYGFKEVYAIHIARDFGYKSIFKKIKARSENGEWIFTI